MQSRIPDADGECPYNITQVSLDNIRFYEDMTGEEVCFYNHKGENTGSGGYKGSMRVSHSVNISDKDSLKEIWQGRYHDGKHMKYTFDEEGTKERTYNIRTYSPKRAFFETKPFKVHVTDWRGNTEIFTFPLEYILEHGKPMETRPKDGKCTDKLE